MKGCPDCKLEDQLTELIYKEVQTIDKRKARRIAKKAAKLIGNGGINAASE